jgi:hypothetical protein
MLLRRPSESSWIGGRPGRKSSRKAIKSSLFETNAPFADRGWTGSGDGGDFEVAPPTGGFKNDPRAVGVAFLGALGAEEFLQLGFFVGGEVERGAWSAHAPQNS